PAPQWKKPSMPLSQFPSKETAETNVTLPTMPRFVELNPKQCSGHRSPLPSFWVRRRNATSRHLPLVGRSNRRRRFGWGELTLRLLCSHAKPDEGCFLCSGGDFFILEQRGRRFASPCTRKPSPLAGEGGAPRAKRAK